jgi:hypothetical protein
VHAALHRIGVAVLRASAWSALAAGAITLALWLGTSGELRPGFPWGTWFGLSWALAFVPTLVMELGVMHVLLEFGPQDMRPRGKP